MCVLSHCHCDHASPISAPLRPIRSPIAILSIINTLTASDAHIPPPERHQYPRYLCGTTISPRKQYLFLPLHASSRVSTARSFPSSTAAKPNLHHQRSRSRSLTCARLVPTAKEAAPIVRLRARTQFSIHPDQFTRKSFSLHPETQTSVPAVASARA